MQPNISRRYRLEVVALAIVFAAASRAASAQQQLPVDSARSSVPATDVAVLNDVRRELAELRAEVLRLESAKPAAAPNAAGPTVSVGSDGFSLKSADRAFEIKVRGYFQTDGRVKVGRNSSPMTSTLLLRRMRPILDVTMWRLMDFHLMPDFADSRLYDANFDLRLSKAFALRAGKFKPPIT